MRILAIDPGNRRTGVAVCDELGLTVRPVGTVDKKKQRDVLGALVQMVIEQKVGRIIVGLALEADGAEGQAARRSRAFCDRLGRRLLAAEVDVPIVNVDESYTTTEAHARLKERGLTPEQRKEVVDQEAAAVLLEGYLRSLVSEGGS